MRFWLDAVAMGVTSGMLGMGALFAFNIYVIEPRTARIARSAMAVSCECLPSRSFCDVWPRLIPPRDMSRQRLTMQSPVAGEIIGFSCEDDMRPHLLGGGLP